MNGYDFAHVIFSEKLTLSARDRLCLEREERATARLQHWHQRDQKRRSEQTEVRQARLATDRQRTHEQRTAEQPETK